MFVLRTFIGGAEIHRRVHMFILRKYEGMGRNS